MIKPQSKTLVLYEGNADDEIGQRAVATLVAPKILVSQKAVVLAEENGNVLATILIQQGLKVREV